MLASLADTAVFFQIGLNVMLRIGGGVYDFSLIGVTLAAVLVARAANVFPISALLNVYRLEKISGAFQVQMWHAGLRGAIAFASALAIPSQNRDTLVNTTSWICLFTIFVLGATTRPLLVVLKIPYGAAISQPSAGIEAAAESSATRKPSKVAVAESLLKRVIYGKEFLADMQKINEETSSVSRQLAAENGVMRA